MKLKVHAAIAFMCLLTTSCASTPDVNLGYYHSKATADLTVNRTFSCNKKKHVIEVVTTDLQPRYVADTWESFRPKDIDGAMANTSMTFEFYDDGRLKSVNAESTGQGSEILKSAISAITTIASIFGLDRGGSAPYPKACKAINDLGDGKPVTVSYKSSGLDLSKDQIDIPVATGSEANQHALKDYIGKVCATVTRLAPLKDAYPTVSPDNKSAKIWLRQPGTATVEVRTNTCTGPSLATHQLTAPQYGKRYPLPIPKARAFGKQTFALEISEAGVATKVGYARETGANQALTVLNAALPEFDGSTAAEKAKAANDRADEIAANARLANCLADPSNCK